MPELVTVLRIVGLSHLLLGVAHVPMWKLFDWSAEIGALTPLTRRVFAVHVFFIVFVLVALGALALACPELLVAPSELARLVLAAGLLFWLLRMIAQPLVFDPVLMQASRHGWLLRRAALLLFALYVAVYGWALTRQLA